MELIVITPCVVIVVPDIGLKLIALGAVLSTVKLRVVALLIDCQFVPLYPIAYMVCPPSLNDEISIDSLTDNISEKLPESILYL